MFHVDKCKVMHFGHNNLKTDYSLDNKTLRKVHQEKDLGVIISDDMKSSHQCMIQAYSKANKMLGVINRAIVYKSKEVMLSLQYIKLRSVLTWNTALLHGAHIM